MPHPEMSVEHDGETDVIITRRFRATPALIFRALTEPSLLQKWLLGPDGWLMPVCEIDLRVGGAYRYRWRSETDGTEFGFFGTFEEIIPDRLLVQTEHPDWDPDLPPAINTCELVSVGDMTEMTLRIHYVSGAARAAVLETGMTEGMRITYDRLDDLVETL